MRQLPKPLWIDDVLYVPILDEHILSLLRELPGTQAPGPALDEVTFNEQRRTVAAHGREAALTRIQFAILMDLVAAEGRVVSIDQILRDVWGWVQPESGTELVRSHIASLRMRLKAGGITDNLIRSVRGGGYRYSPGLSADEPAAVAEFM